MFPVFTLEGASHMSFMSGTPPEHVMKKDLRAEVAETDAHAAFANQMASFISQITTSSVFDETSTFSVLKPLITAMKEEGSYAMKPPCNDDPLINRTDDPTCNPGCPWTQKFSQNLMGGTFEGNPYINVVNDDNFHPVYQFHPVHLAEIDSTCDKNVLKECRINTVTVSENHY